MNALRPVLAVLLLSAWTVGGVLAPVAHDATHSAERAERLQRIAQTHGDHHHHDADDAHGTEAQPFCPEQTDLELTCALCWTTVAAVLTSSEVALQPTTSPIDAVGREHAAGPTEIGHDTRGPPVS